MESCSQHVGTGSERRQAQKDKYCMIPLICKSQSQRRYRHHGGYLRLWSVMGREEWGKVDKWALSHSQGVVSFGVLLHSGGL